MDQIKGSSGERSQEFAERRSGGELGDSAEEECKEEIDIFFLFVLHWCETAERRCAV